MDAAQMMFFLTAGHALADYPLQGEFLAMGKNRAKPSPFTPWYQALAAHALIHGLIVGLITGIWWLGLAETVAHAAIDDSKCTGKIGFNTDQVLHIACKAAWVLIAMAVTR